MQIVEFSADSLRFLDAPPETAPARGFVWMVLAREELDAARDVLQQAAQRLGGSPLLDLHLKDLGNAAHPSRYDATSVYDLVIFRRLATPDEARAEPDAAPHVTGTDSGGNPVAPSGTLRPRRSAGPPAFQRIASRAVGFALFDHLLISVHPPGCLVARQYLERAAGDARLSLDAASARNRTPSSPTDLVLRLVNSMVDGYLDLRKTLSSQLDHWQGELLRPNSRFSNWGALMAARSQLQLLEDLCDGQHDAVQEWLDTLRALPLDSFAVDAALAVQQRDPLVARARDVLEHIQRVVQHVRRLEHAAETAVQIHFSAQSHRANDIMRTLTALTAIFLPLNLITGLFGMNFEFMPFIHHPGAFWWTLGLMVSAVTVTGLVFWRKRYLARSGR